MDPCPLILTHENQKSPPAMWGCQIFRQPVSRPVASPGPPCPPIETPKKVPAENLSENLMSATPRSSPQRVSPSYRWSAHPPPPPPSIWRVPFFAKAHKSPAEYPGAPALSLDCPQRPQRIPWPQPKDPKSICQETCRVSLEHPLLEEPAEARPVSLKWAPSGARLRG